MRERLTVACEVWGGHILNGDLLKESWLLTARVSTDHPGLLQPLTQPGQMTITHIRVGQEVTMKIKRDRDRERETEIIEIGSVHNKINGHFLNIGCFLNMLLHNHSYSTSIFPQYNPFFPQYNEFIMAK